MRPDGGCTVCALGTAGLVATLIATPRRTVWVSAAGRGRGKGAAGGGGRRSSPARGAPASRAVAAGARRTGRGVGEHALAGRDRTQPGVGVDALRRRRGARPLDGRPVRPRRNRAAG